ncbi:neprilysin-1-like protein [Dinothrombium tinctorium]|uniref:Neprilysin-1-like protein n=1 Tax=Dinothrombium tinctorium TaxID=1965070 RepID=A0A443QJ92_9ACAR|nr:neprilysin-1-like protein [Dinothrombium tinctorium]
MLIAESLYANINLNVDPCDDFYKFTCGKWAQVHPRPKGEEQWGNFILLSKQIKTKLKDALEDKSHYNSTAVKKAQNFYTACNDLTFRDEFGLLELRRILEKAGGFPMISKHWDKDEYNWVDAYIYTDIKIRDSRKTFLTETDKNDWRYRKEEDTLRNKIKQRIKRLKTDHTDEELDKDIDDLFALERSILNLKKDGYFYEGPDEINTTLEELEEEYPNVSHRFPTLF